jgi:phage-related minor tail protein
MTFVDPGSDPTGAASELSSAIDGLTAKTNSLGISAGAFAKAMAKAFTDATTGGKQFDDVLKSLALRLSNLAVTQAFKPLATDITKGLNSMLGGLLGAGSVSANAMGAIKPFAAGGVIGTPTYFPLSAGGLGLAGEAGPEAIMPLTRGPDGQLGVSVAGSAAPANVTVQIATPDVGGFRRSEAYLTGQIARAVARGQRNL